MNEKRMMYVVTRQLILGSIESSPFFSVFYFRLFIFLVLHFSIPIIIKKVSSFVLRQFFLLNL